MDLSGVAVALVVGAAAGGVLIGFMSAAVAELVARLAAWLECLPGERRDLRRDQFLEVLQLKPVRERPVEAGSMLWAGVTGFLRREHIGPRARCWWMAYIYRGLRKADAADRIEQRPHRSVVRTALVACWLGFFRGSVRNLSRLERQGFLVPPGARSINPYVYVRRALSLRNQRQRRR